MSTGEKGFSLETKSRSQKLLFNVFEFGPKMLPASLHDAHFSELFLKSNLIVITHFLGKDLPYF